MPSSDPAEILYMRDPSILHMGTGESGTVYNLTAGAEKYTVTVNANGHPLKMEVDTGSVVSIINENTYTQILKDCALNPTSLKLLDYNKASVPLLGVTQVPITYKTQEESLPVVVTKGDHPNLLGRNWLTKLKLDWQEVTAYPRTEVNAVSENDPLNEVLKTYDSVFRDGLGKIKHFKAHLHVQPDAKPVFMRPRPVPYALKPAVEKELERLENEGVIRQIECSQWAAPTVNVPKGDTVRSCGDYKVTVNPVT